MRHGRPIPHTARQARTETGWHASHYNLCTLVAPLLSRHVMVVSLPFSVYDRLNYLRYNAQPTTAVPFVRPIIKTESE